MYYSSLPHHYVNIRIFFPAILIFRPPILKPTQPSKLSSINLPLTVKFLREIQSLYRPLYQFIIQSYVSKPDRNSHFPLSVKILFLKTRCVRGINPNILPAFFSSSNRGGFGEGFLRPRPQSPPPSPIHRRGHRAPRGGVAEWGGRGAVLWAVAANQGVLTCDGAGPRGRGWDSFERGVREFQNISKKSQNISTPKLVKKMSRSKADH